MGLDLKNFFRIFLKWFWMISIFIAIGTLTTAYLSFYVLKPKYEAQTKLIVNKTRVVDGERAPNTSDIEANIQLIHTYKELITTDWIIDEVLKNYPEFKSYTAKELMDQVKVSSMNATQVMTISTKNTSYARAARLVNAVTDEFVQKIPGLMQVENVTVLDRADERMKPDPVSPSPRLNILLAIIGSLIIGTLYAFLKEHFDESLEDEEEIERFLGIPILAGIETINLKDYQKQAEKKGEMNYATSKSTSVNYGYKS